MKKYNMKKIPIYLLAGLIGGTISYGIFNNNLEKKVSELYEKEAKKFRVDVNIEGADKSFHFSDHKKFISGNKDTYYETKQGFTYVFEDIEKENRENSVYKNRYGQEYNYGITHDKDKPQNLRITYYDKYFKNSASIDASEKDEITNIYLSD